MCCLRLLFYYSFALIDRCVVCYRMSNKYWKQRLSKKKPNHYCPRMIVFKSKKSQTWVISKNNIRIEYLYALVLAYITNLMEQN